MKETCTRVRILNSWCYEYPMVASIACESSDFSVAVVSFPFHLRVKLEFSLHVHL